MVNIIFRSIEKNILLIIPSHPEQTNPMELLSDPTTRPSVNAVDKI